MDCQLNTIDRVYGWSTTRGTCPPATFFSNASQLYVGANLSGRTAATDSTQWFQHTFISGIVGLLAQHLIPVYNNISLHVPLNPTAKGMLMSGTSNPNWYIDNIEFHCNFINLKDEIIHEIMPHDGVYKFNTTSITNFQSVLSSGATVVEQLLPFKLTSLKSIYTGFRPQTALTNVTYPINNQYNYAIFDYQYRIGSQNYPQTRVKCSDHGYTEPFYKLQKSFHHSPNALTSFGTRDTCSYMNTSNWTADHGSFSGNNSSKVQTPGTTFLIGINLEAYVTKGNEVIAGISSKYNDIYFHRWFLAS